MSGSADAVGEGKRGEALSRGLEQPTSVETALLALAAVDVLALFVVDVYADFLPGAVDGRVLIADLGLVVVFAVAFLVRAAQASEAARYARTHWYDLVGLIPIAHWAFRSFRLVGFLRAYVVRQRPIGGSSGKHWTDELARLAVARYRDVQVDELADPLVVSSIERLRDPLAATRWSEAIGGSLDARRPQIRACVGDALTQDPRLGRLARTRPGRYLVGEVTDATLAATVETLRSEEMDRALGEAVEEALDGVRDRVEAT